LSRFARFRKNPVVGRVTTALAALVVLAALLAPDGVDRLTPGAFVRLPIEALAGLALVLVLPARARRPVAALLGVALGLIVVVKALDIGSFTVLARQFDLVLDWAQLGGALAVLTGSVGRAGAIGAVVGAILLAVAVVALTTLSALRLAGAATRHRRASARSATAVGVAWVACAVLGAQLVPGVPVADRSAAALVQDRAQRVRAGLHDRQAFAAAAAADAYRDVPGDRLLTALRGKDVVFAFIESYGRDAVEKPEFAAQVGAVLDDGTRRLGAKGFTSRSAFLTSSTAGGYSWLAHSTFHSGLWIDNQQRYRTLVASNRLTLTGAFRRAGWQTVAIEPNNTYAWPEGDFYGYQRVHDSRNLGYRGPAFSWSAMPDQYTLSAFQREEYSKPGRGPLTAEVTLTSSHTPWAPVPRLIDWRDVGDGSVYNAMVKEGASPDEVWKDPARVRTEYRRSIEYSVGSLISWAETYGNDNLVLVFLCDHQPAPIVTGQGASHDVPIAVVTRDRAVLDRIAGWGWQDGLKPGPQAPVWRMDSFRDRFLGTFGPQPGQLR
jgi:hypothetical protein